MYVSISRAPCEREGQDSRLSAEEQPQHTLEGTDQALSSISLGGCQRKKPTIVVAAIAHELAAFIWAIGYEIRSTMAAG
jgi:hypothetical protein